MARKAKTRSLIRKPKDYPRITERYIIGNGTPKAVVASCIIYNVGNCSGASPDNPHNKGERPTTCDACFAVS